MKKHKLNFSTQFIIVVCLLLLFVNVVLGALLMGQSSKSMKTLIRRHMLSVADTAAASVDGDILGSITKDDVGTEKYRNMATKLEGIVSVQKDVDIKYIYAVKKQGKDFIFTVDPDKENPAEYGKKVVYTPGQSKAWSGVSSVDDEAYADEWGEFFTAWSPVRDSSGQVVSIIGVDFSAEWYNKQVSTHVQSVIIASALSVVFGGAIVFLFSQQLRRRIHLLNSELSVLSSKMEELEDEIRLNRDVDDKPNRNPSEEFDGNSDNIELLTNKIHGMQERLKNYVQHLHDQAYTDTMTGVENKTAYLEYVKELNHQINVGTANFAVVVFDIDGLKNTNDNFGHECGDQIITDTATYISAVFGDDRVFRIGGDEFIAVLSNTTQEDLDEKFARLKEAIEDFNKNKKRYVMTLSFSWGGAIYEPGRDADFKNVFKRADDAMYLNKDKHYENSREQRRID